MTKQELPEFDRHLSGYDAWSERFPLLAAAEERAKLQRHEDLYYELVYSCAQANRSWFSQRYPETKPDEDGWFSRLWEKRPTGRDIVTLINQSKDTCLIERFDEWLAIREYLIASNIRLVFKVAHRHTDRGLSLLDLAQEGQFGLIRALERFRCDKELRFSTYATHWVTQYIRLAIKKQTRVVSIPTNVQDEMMRLNKAIVRAQQSDGRTVSATEVARRREENMDRADQLISLARPSQSLDDPLVPGSNLTAMDSLAADSASPELAHHGEEQRALVSRLISYLSPREQMIVEMRYGINMPTEYGYREIAEQLNLSRERVRQLEKQALAYLHDQAQRLGTH